MSSKKGHHSPADKDLVWLGYDLHLDHGYRPTKIHYWKEDRFQNTTPQPPLKFHADAITGLAGIHLNTSIKNPFHSPHYHYGKCHEAWLTLEPHQELYLRSQSRVQSLKKNLKAFNPSVEQYFERNISDILESVSHPWGLDLNHLHYFIDAIDYLESKLNSPLLYNFQVNFTKTIIEKLQFLHSFLYNLRALVAFDYNSQIKDPTYEAVHVDAITDYLSKAEYVANDAMLYFHFKKMSAKIPTSVKKELEKKYIKFCHNGYCLIENLPPSFLKAMNNHQLEETLYIVQMDWLLGTETGLLYRIREELFGLVEGYDKVFWPECSGLQSIEKTKLEINCEVNLDMHTPQLDPLKKVG